MAVPGQTIAVALAALAAESLALSELLASPPGLSTAAAIHLLATGGLAAWYRFSPGIRADVRVPLLLVATTAALGPFGPVITLLTMALARQFLRHATPFEEWYGALFPELADETEGDLARRAANVSLENPASLAPFTEVLSYGSLLQKQALIALINKSFRPAFGPILKRALGDENNAVRVQAATAMNRIENLAHAQTVELERRLRQRPGDPGTLIELARHYDGLLYSGIPDSRREEEIRRRALEVWDLYLAARPGDIESQVAASRLRLRSGLCEEAASSLKKIIDAGAASAQASLWYMESLYRLGRFAELRAYAKQPEAGADMRADLPSIGSEAMQVWAERDSVAP
jgi:hypothetical protein